VRIAAWIVVWAIAAHASAARVVVDDSAFLPVVRVERGGRTVFEHRFDRPQVFFHTEISPSGHYLLIWRHGDRPPRRLTIFRIGDGKQLADFVPGFGGRMMWTRGDKILHSWGCGTNCQNIAAYDITGGELHGENVTGHELTRDGYYLVFPTMPAKYLADASVYAYDVNTGAKTVLRRGLPDAPHDLQVEPDAITFTFGADHDDVRVPLPTYTRPAPDASVRAVVGPGVVTVEQVDDAEHDRLGVDGVTLTEHMPAYQWEIKDLDDRTLELIGKSQIIRPMRARVEFAGAWRSPTDRVYRVWYVYYDLFLGRDNIRGVHRVCFVREGKVVRAMSSGDRVIVRNNKLVRPLPDGGYGAWEEHSVIIDGL
jgi:hypothetical protein